MRPCAATEGTLHGTLVASRRNPRGTIHRLAPAPNVRIFWRRGRPEYVYVRKACSRAVLAGPVLVSSIGGPLPARKLCPLCFPSGLFAEDCMVST